MREDRRILREVQDLIHPLVRHELGLFWRLAETAGEECAAAEIPLYLENNGCIEENGFAAPLIIGVYCEDEKRHARLAASRGWSEETQAALDSWQWSQARKMKACDTVLNNSATPEHLARQAAELLAHVRALRENEEEELAARLTGLWT
jgi:23S rRNA pseudouridine1911/1915/1917 synthase